jgi:hypothetical protein
LLVCGGDEEASGIFIPGIFIGPGVDEGDGFGVGEGIECPGCCARVDAAAAKDIATTSKRRTICEVFIRSTRTLPLMNGAA